MAFGIQSSNSLDKLAFRPIMGNPITNISYPQEGDMRTRRIVKRSNARTTGKYPSIKMDRMIQWESDNERVVFKLLDANPDILCFHEQPLVIAYQLDEEPHHHFPDVYVETENGKEIWEIKCAEHASDPKNVARTKLMTEALPAFGFQYRLIIADNLKKSVEYKNASTLLHYGRDAIPGLERERLRLLLTDVPMSTWEALANAIGPMGRNYVSRLLLEGVLRYDPAKEINSETVLYYALNGKAIVNQEA